MILNNILDQIYILPEISKLRLKSLIIENSYPRNHHLFFANQKVNRFYFLKEGICRAYANREGREVTFWLGKEGDCIFPLQTLYSIETTYENLELVTSCTFYEIDLQDLQKLFFEDIHIANWGRMSLEREYIKSEKQFITRQFKTASERYYDLLQEFPGITQKIALGVIASYLGISQVSLSRIRAKVK